LYDGFIVESCNGTKVVAATAQSPVQIGEEFWRRVDDNARRSNDFVRSDIITSKTVRVCEIANPSTKSKTANTDVCSLDRVNTRWIMARWLRRTYSATNNSQVVRGEVMIHI
jgi:hypothetical protein